MDKAKGDKTPQLNGAVISMTAGRKYPKLKRVVIQVIVIVLVVTGLITWWFYATQNTRTIDGAKKELSKHGVAWKDLNTTQQVQYLSDHGNYSAAQSLYSEQHAAAKNKEEKVEILFLQSSLALQARNLADAQKYADEAHQTDPKSNNAYVALAQVAAAKGNKQLAKQDYEQATKLLDKNAANYNLMVFQYQSSIEALN